MIKTMQLLAGMNSNFTEHKTNIVMSSSSYSIEHQGKPQWPLHSIQNYTVLCGEWLNEVDREWNYTGGEECRGTQWMECSLTLQMHILSLTLIWQKMTTWSPLVPVSCHALQCLRQLTEGSFGPESSRRGALNWSNFVIDLHMASSNLWDGQRKYHGTVDVHSLYSTTDPINEIY